MYKNKALEHAVNTDEMTERQKDIKSREFSLSLLLLLDTLLLLLRFCHKILRHRLSHTRTDNIVKPSSAALVVRSAFNIPGLHYLEQLDL